MVRKSFQRTRNRDMGISSSKINFPLLGLRWIRNWGLRRFCFILTCSCSPASSQNILSVLLCFGRLCSFCSLLGFSQRCFFGGCRNPSFVFPFLSHSFLVSLLLVDGRRLGFCRPCFGFCLWLGFWGWDFVPRNGKWSIILCLLSFSLLFWL